MIAEGKWNCFVCYPSVHAIVHTDSLVRDCSV